MNGMTAKSLSRSFVLMFVLLSGWTTALTASPTDDGRKLASLFEQQVTRRLNVPQAEQEHYAQLLTSTLEQDGLARLLPQYVMLVDRNPHVQAAMIFWKSPSGPFYMIGATPVSTGVPGRYEHFVTPLGVFEHVTSHPDFRSKGTPNRFGIRGYGARGLRIFDFGWVQAAKGWGDHGLSRLRLQVHATDPNRLMRWLGTPQSEGCVRTTASFNRFLDHYGILDGDYERAEAKGHRFSVLSSRRAATPWSGRYLVVVDSERHERPAWARVARPARATDRAKR